MNINMYQWLDAVIKNKKKQAMPLLSFPSVQLSKKTIKELVLSSDNLAEGIENISNFTPSSLACVSFMDLSIEAECFGCKVEFTDNEIPNIVAPIVFNEDDAIKLVVPSLESGRALLNIQAIKKATSLIKDKPVFAGVIGSFSLAGRLCGVSEMLMNCYEEPEMVHTVLKKATEFIINYIKGFKEAGANGVIIAEPLTGLLSPSLCEEFSEPYLKEIVDTVQDENFIVIYHNCGNTVTKIIDSLLRIGAKGYHFGNAINLKDVASKIPNDVLLMGNVDPVNEFLNGTKESINIATNDLLSLMKDYDNFVISSGCDIPPHAKLDNIKEFFLTVDNFYKDL